MNTHQVLFLTDDIDSAAVWLSGLQQFDRTHVITLALRQYAAAYIVAGFNLVVIEAEADTMVAVLETCRTLRSWMDNPILVVLSLDDEEYALEAHKAGADEYIVKPISLDLLRAKLTAWQRWSVPVPRPVLLSGSADVSRN